MALTFRQLRLGDDLVQLGVRRSAEKRAANGGVHARRHLVALSRRESRHRLRAATARIPGEYRRGVRHRVVEEEREQVIPDVVVLIDVLPRPCDRVGAREVGEVPDGQNGAREGGERRGDTDARCELCAGEGVTPPTNTNTVHVRAPDIRHTKKKRKKERFTARTGPGRRSSSADRAWRRGARAQCRWPPQRR